MWKDMVETEMPQKTILLMRISRSIPKATNRRLGYVIFIAFLLQQWLQVGASVLLYTYIPVLLVRN